MLSPCLLILPISNTFSTLSTSTSPDTPLHAPRATHTLCVCVAHVLLVHTCTTHLPYHIQHLPQGSVPSKMMT
jgi:hypothetical protein